MAEQVLIRIDGLDRETGTVNVTIDGTAHGFPLPLDRNYEPLRGVALRNEVIDQALACHHTARAEDARCRAPVARRQRRNSPFWPGRSTCRRTMPPIAKP